MSLHRVRFFQPGTVAGSFGRSLTVLFLLGLPTQLALAETTPAAAVATAPFVPYKVKQGVAIERRAVPGSRYFEYRAGFTTPLALPVIAELLWRGTSESNEVVKKREVLRDTATERVYYDQVSTPVVSDRDYTILMRKVADSGGQRFQLTYQTANDLGPPPRPGFVRINHIHGSWTAEPDGQGGTRMTYLNFSDPGGSIPAFMAHGAQVDNVAAAVVRLQEKLRKLAK